MLRQIILFGLFIMIFSSNLSANEMSESERLKITKSVKNEFIADLDSLIANKKSSGSEFESNKSAIKMFNEDLRQILIFYEYIVYGDKFTQKKGIDGLKKWYGNKEKHKKFQKDDLFENYKEKITNELFYLLEDEYPVIQVSSANTLIFMGIRDSLLTKIIKYYSGPLDHDKWNLKHTDAYVLTSEEDYKFGSESGFSRKDDAIREIIRKAIEGAGIINKEFRRTVAKTKLPGTDDYSSYMGIPTLDEDSWYSDTINWKIQQNQELSKSLIQQLYFMVTRDKEIDIRELNMVLKFLQFGDNNAKKTAIEILPISIKKNLSVIENLDYDYFYNVLKPNVNSQYPALITESCISLYKISMIYKQNYDDTLLSKLEYYARGIDSENWNLEHTLIYRDYNPSSNTYNRICEEKDYDREEYVKERAINEIRHHTVRCLFSMNNENADKILISIITKETEKSSSIERLIRTLFGRRENGEKLFNLIPKREFNRDGIVHTAEFTKCYVIGFFADPNRYKKLR